MDEQLSQPKKVVGYRQSLKALNNMEIYKAFIAQDAEPSMIDEFKKECLKANVQIEIIDDKETLGKMCGIERPASVACLLK